MLYRGNYHVFYSGCADNTPQSPDYTDKYYKRFEDRSNALTYAHDMVNKIDKESYVEGFSGVEYGVCEITIVDKPFTDNLNFKTKFKQFEEQLIYKENAIKERLCVLEDKVRNIEFGEPRKRKDGCYQFTYCNECIAFPMGLGCPNLTKGPVQLKDEVKHGKQN